jgi:small subunit ribosomal protein S21
MFAVRIAGFVTGSDCSSSMSLFDVGIAEGGFGIGAGRSEQIHKYLGGPMAEVHVHEGESIESALRRFKREVQQEDIIKEVKKHSFYMKPGEQKRVKGANKQKAVETDALILLRP